MLKASGAPPRWKRGLHQWCPPAGKMGRGEGPRAPGGSPTRKAVVWGPRAPPPGPRLAHIHPSSAALLPTTSTHLGLTAEELRQGRPSQEQGPVGGAHGDPGRGLRAFPPS